jgi:hypothetical protein
VKISYLLLCSITVFVLNTTLMYAQPSKGGTPPSILYNVQNNLQLLDYSPNINLKSLMLQDSINEKQGYPLRGGLSVAVNGVGLDNGGTWTKLPDGRMMWQAMFHCNNAKAIGVVFDNFYIPEQAELPTLTVCSEKGALKQPKVAVKSIKCF